MTTKVEEWHNKRGYKITSINSKKTRQDGGLNRINTRKKLLRVYADYNYNERHQLPGRYEGLQQSALTFTFSYINIYILVSILKMIMEDFF